VLPEESGKSGELEEFEEPTAAAKLLARLEVEVPVREAQAA
jgi:hypothetical protein